VNLDLLFFLLARLRGDLGLETLQLRLERANLVGCVIGARGALADRQRAQGHRQEGRFLSMSNHQFHP
jgi:hypothetical protein